MLHKRTVNSAHDERKAVQNSARAMSGALQDGDRSMKLPAFPERRRKRAETLYDDARELIEVMDYDGALAIGAKLRKLRFSGAFGRGWRSRQAPGPTGCCSAVVCRISAGTVRPSRHMTPQRRASAPIDP